MQLHVSLEEGGCGSGGWGQILYTNTWERMWRWSREKFKDADLEDCGDIATNQGRVSVTRSWKKQRDSLLEPQEIYSILKLCQYLWIYYSKYRKRNTYTNRSYPKWALKIANLIGVCKGPHYSNLTSSSFDVINIYCYCLTIWLMKSSN